MINAIYRKKDFILAYEFTRIKLLYIQLWICKRGLMFYTIVILDNLKVKKLYRYNC